MFLTKIYTINQISHGTVIGIIDATLDNFYVHTVDDPKYYKRKLKQAFSNSGMKFVVEKKADTKYITCSTESVVVKVTNDRLIKNYNYSESQITFEHNHQDDIVEGSNNQKKKREKYMI